jgi:arylsulfatase A-like enzyme
MIDRNIGELFGLLKELNIDEKTIVFFCSDNGASNRFEGTLDSSGPLSGFKRSMHEGGIRVPLIVHWPGKIRGGKSSDLPTYFPDVMPTLAELAGAEEHLPKDIDGLSIAPTLTAKGTQVKHEYLYWEWPAYNWRKSEYTGKMMQGVRHGKWKMLRNNNAKPWELYDLSKDVAERHNIADEHGELVKRLDAWVRANRTDPPVQKEPPKPKGKRYR